MCVLKRCRDRKQACANYASRFSDTRWCSPFRPWSFEKRSKASFDFFTSLNSTCRKVHFSHSLLRRKEGSRKSGTSRDFSYVSRVSLQFPGMKSSPVFPFELFPTPFKVQPRPFPSFSSSSFSFFRTSNQHFSCHRASLPFEKEFRRDFDAHPFHICHLTDVIIHSKTFNNRLRVPSWQYSRKFP